MYRPVARRYEIRKDGMGWGSNRDGLHSLSLEYLLGATGESVIVESARDPLHEHVALTHLVFEYSVLRRPRFPLLIERERASLLVDGRARQFRVYSAGAAAVATGAVEDVQLMIRCSRRRLSRLTLVRVDDAELREALGKL